MQVGACLSLTGRYARFGAQAAAGLEAWRALDRGAELAIADDRSDPAELARAIRAMATSCDLLLGPYSTQLMGAASRALAGRDCVIWNHGGAGGGADVGGQWPARIVPVLTAGSRYAEPFLRWSSERSISTPVRVVQGRGSFGRLVAMGAESIARRLGLDVIRVGAGDALPAADFAGDWTMFSVGTFEDDVAVVRRALARPRPPRLVCSVAAGVREFVRAVPAPDGVFGVAQWFPSSGARTRPELGPTEAEFLAAYRRRSSGTAPDYPAVQAAAAAVLAVHCARLAGETAPDALWAAATSLDTTTLFGRFRLDPETGAQVGHEMVLVRWSAGEPKLISK